MIKYSDIGKADDLKNALDILLEGLEMERLKGCIRRGDRGCGGKRGGDLLRHYKHLYHLCAQARFTSCFPFQ